MEAALPSEVPHPPWVPTDGRPRGRGDTWHDFPTSCQDMHQSSSWWEGKPSSQWVVCVLSHRMGPCENLHSPGKCPHAWGHETLNSKENTIIDREKDSGRKEKALCFNFLAFWTGGSIFLLCTRPSKACSQCCRGHWESKDELPAPAQMVPRPSGKL